MKSYLRYVAAILAVSLAILLRFALIPLIGYGIPYIILFPVTVSVALFAGMGPAVLTGLFGSIITDYFFIQPLHTIVIDTPHVTRVIIVVLTSAFVGYIGDMLRAGRARAEKQALALTENEARLKRSQEIAHLGSWELDLANNNLTWSDEVYRIFGLQPQEFDATYEAFLERVHPDDRAAVNDAYSGSLREGRDTYEIEHRVIRKATGEIRIVHEKCQHFRDETGKIIRSVGMVHDITERKTAEEKLIRAKEEWERTFDSVPDMIAILDENYHIVRVNKAMAEKLGVNAEQCAGLVCYQCVHETSGPPAFCPHALTLADGKYHIAEVYEERLGGDLLVSTSPLFNENGKLIGSVHVARDITEQKKSEKEIKSLNEDLRGYVIDLEAANKELDAFSYSVSHDLRAPLRGIDGFSLALLEDYADKLDDNGRDYLERMRAGTQRMGQLIDDLLNLSRVTRVRMSRENINLSAIAGKVADRLKKTSEKHEVEFIIAENLLAYCDANLLNVVFENLLGNAWKFTEKRKAAKIEFGVMQSKPPLNPLLNQGGELVDSENSPPNLGGVAEGRGGGMVYFVRDNGAGFDKTYAEKLFTPFQRLHTMEEFPGTGIGLATVKRVIERHGGKVWIEGEVDKGATVYFTL
ncbi:MAG: PAS domain S-box protein [Nitrospirae bacterium]|nr:MAG: PAS domain S-box protein [Nitrospirota bacterium]